MHNFNGHWIEVFSAGKQRDHQGREWDITSEFLEQVASSYDPAQHEAPAVIGHPDNDAPAYGWVAALRVNDDRLEAQFRDVDSQFEQLVKDGKFKKRSASFYVDQKTAPNSNILSLRHVGFLGATPPAVKGLRNIQFSEGESVAFESINFSEDETMFDEKAQEGFAAKLVEKLKAVFGGKTDEGQPASVDARSFSEADLTAKIAEAVKSATAAATANFNEKMTALETDNKALRKQVEQQATSTTRAELISFCERLGPAKCPPAFREMGLIEFMEAISGVEQKVTVISFSEEGDKKVETKTESAPLMWFRNFMEKLPAFIQFGEGFGSLKTSAGAADAISPERQEELRTAAGLTAKGGAQ